MQDETHEVPVGGDVSGMLERIESADSSLAGAAILASPVRRAIVDALSSRPLRPHVSGEPRTGMTAAQLGALLELHVTTVRFHLDQLVAGGLVSAEFERGHGVGRPRKVYTVASGSLEADIHDRGLKILTGLLAESFGDGQVTPAEAGARWARQNMAPDTSGVAHSPGEWLTKVGQMIDVLGEWGYTPDLTTSEGGRTCRIDLVRCPFLEMAKTNPAVVCGIHRGLIAGAMEQLGEPDTDVSLEPFVGPELCQAHIRTRTPFRSRTTTSEED